MFRSKFLNVLMSLLVIASMTLGTTGQVVAQSGAQTPAKQGTGGGNLHGKVTPAERQAAAERQQAAYKKAGLSTQAAGVMNPGGVPDYFGIVPNYANSPLPTLDVNGVPLPGTGMRKFVDTLPGLGPTGINDLGQYIPVAQADTTTYPGSDYYEIAVVQFTEQLHLDLPPTTIRGYVQISTSVVPGAHIQLFYPDGVTPILDNKGAPVYAVDNPHYLGPLIVAQSYNPAFAPGATLPTGGLNGQPSRIKFDNYLPAGVAGDLFIPTDTSYMGAGMGPTGEVTGISIVSGGAGYTSVPTVSISSGTSGVNATAEATILNGVVNSLHITNPGTLYSSAPSVVISGGGASVDATAAVSFIGAAPAAYTENRATLHLHGGVTPWISDGTPHQWVTPATENTPYPAGVSVVNVPDMADPGPGSQTFFYTNEQSARLMFYHDHAYGLTRLNVYVGEAAGYLVQDATEQAMIANGTLPATEIPLVIQDKTFVPDTPQLANEDPTWDPAKWGGKGNFWFPHVYMPNQNPFDLAGVNAMGRWDYGPWFWPPYTGLTYGPAANPLVGTTPTEGPDNPGVPLVSGTPEGFMDTPLINGTAYPVLNVPAQPVRFRILSVANDRFFNLQLYQSSPIISKVTITNPGSGYIDPPAVTITSAAGDPGQGATALATVDTDPLSPTFGQVIDISLWTVGSGYIATPTVTITPPPAGGVAASAVATVYSGDSEVGMVPFTSSQNAISAFPSAWYTAGNPFTLDDRNGGVPDPTKRGPAFVQVGTEGGILPNPAVIKNQPVNYTYNRRDIVVLSVQEHALFLGPAERADVVVDFSNFAGKTLILYNDSPAPVPASDPRNDYFTANPDLTSSGGAPSTLAGYGPNTRTIMKIVVGGSGGTAPVDDVNAANLAVLKTAVPAAFAATQPVPVVPEPEFSAAYGTAFLGHYSRISDNSMNFTPIGQAAPLTMPFHPKAIQELFTVDYGRMNATLGVEIPNSNATIQTTIPYGYIDPGTELLEGTIPGTPIGSLADGSQLWKITHNGVDTHVIHFHLFNVEVLNRVGWDGAVRPPDANEQGWKDTVRMNPLEDVVVALTPIIPVGLPFQVPNSIRPYDVTQPIGSTMGYFGVDPNGLPSAVVNSLVNFGWEYVWHCHILGHEENDMMRPMMIGITPATPTTLTATPAGGSSVTLSWANLANNATTFVIQRATDSGFATGLTIFDSGGNLVSFTDTNATPGPSYFYRVAASNVIGGGNAPGFPSLPMNSGWSNTSVIAGNLPLAPTGLSATALNGGTVRLTWTDNATNETGFEIQRSDNGGPMTSLAASAPVNPGAGIVNFVDLTTGGPNGYTYQVRAVTAGVGNSAYSVPTASVTLPTPPVAPTGLTVALSSGTSVVLSWTNNAVDANGFVIERSVNGGAFSVLTPLTANLIPVAAGATSFTDATTILGSTYAYQLRAYNTGGYSAYTTPVASILVSLPAAPTNLVGVYQAGPQIALSWTDNAVNETSFVVERAANGGAFATLTTLAPFAGTGLVGYNDTTVLDNNSYAYRVKAVNGIGSSAYTNTVTVVTLPAAPSNVVLTLINGGIQVTWTDNALYETGFDIVQNINGTYTFLTSVAANSGTGIVTYIDLTTLGATSYGYVIRATNAAGPSAYAYSALVTTNATPGTPTGLTATLQTGGLVALRWTDRSTNETAFLVERSLNGGAFSVLATVPAKAGSGTAVTFTDATALAGNTYSYRVRAVTLGASSAYTGVASVTLPALPPAPTGLTALPAATRAVTLTWTDNALTETGFSIERSVNGGAFVVLATRGVFAGTGVVTYSDTSAVAGTAYVYQVRAYNLGGYSAYTNQAALTPAAPTSVAPLNATAIQTSATQGQLTLTWIDPLTETSFTVQRTNATFTTAQNTVTLPAGTTLYQRTGLTRGTTYYYRVRANNGFGSSAWSNVSIKIP